YVVLALQGGAQVPPPEGGGVGVGVGGGGGGGVGVGVGGGGVPPPEHGPKSDQRAGVFGGSPPAIAVEPPRIAFQLCPPNESTSPTEICMPTCHGGAQAVCA